MKLPLFHHFVCVCVLEGGTYKMAASCGSTSYLYLHFSVATTTTKHGDPWLVGECSIPIPSQNYGKVESGVGTLVYRAKGDIPYVWGFALHSKSYFSSLANSKHSIHVNCNHTSYYTDTANIALAFFSRGKNQSIVLPWP